MSDHASWAYTEAVKDHFMNPRNVLKDDETFEENGRGLVGNAQCGDEMLVVIQVDDDSETIQDCRWQTYGCASAIASTSVMSELVKGMPLDKAFRVSPKDIAKELGQLPQHKVHCSVLGDKALRAAINDYYERAGKLDKVVKDEATVICECMNVTDHEIEDAVLEGARTIYDLQEQTKIGTACGTCLGDAGKLLERYLEEHFGDLDD